MALYSLFHRLYGMFPNHFLDHMRVMCRSNSSGGGGGGGLRGDARRRREIAAAFDHVVRDWLKGVRLHPMLVTSSMDHECSRQRWQRKESHDILVDCSRYALDMIESTAADCGFVLGLADVPAELSPSSPQEVALLPNIPSGGIQASLQQAAMPKCNQSLPSPLSYAQYLTQIQSSWCNNTNIGMLPSSLSTDGTSIRSLPSTDRFEICCDSPSNLDFHPSSDKLESTGDFVAATRPQTLPSEPTNSADSNDVTVAQESATDELKDSLPLGDDPSDDEGIAVSRPPLVHGLVRRIRLNTVGPMGDAVASPESVHRHSRSISCPESCVDSDDAVQRLAAKNASLHPSVTFEGTASQKDNGSGTHKQTDGDASKMGVLAP